MNKTIKFEVHNLNRLTEKAFEYFNQSGFKLIDKNDNNLKFRRGSFLSGAWTFNPLKWKSEITVEFVGQEIKADFEIDTPESMVTLKEENLWNSFIDNFKLYLTDGIDYKTANKEALRKIQKNGIKYVGWAVLGALIGGIAASFIAHLTGIDSINLFGVPVGAIIILRKKINDERKKNAL